MKTDTDNHHPELPFQELAVLESLKDYGVDEVYGEPLSNLHAKALKRREAFRLLLAAERAFGDAKSTEESVKTAQNKCDRAQEILKEIGYPPDQRFAPRRRAVEGDIRRAQELRAALERWLVIRKRTEELDKAVGAVQEQAEKQRGELAEALGAFHQELRERRQSFTGEAESRRVQVLQKQEELEKAIIKMTQLVTDQTNAFMADLSSLRELESSLSRATAGEQEDLIAWSEFVNEVSRVYDSLRDMHPPYDTVSPIVASLEVRKEGLSGRWKEKADSMYERLKEHVELTHQALIDMYYWQHFNDQIPEIDRKICLLENGSFSATDADILLVPAKATLKKWEEISPKPSRLRDALAKIMEAKERNEKFAPDFHKKQRRKEADGWITLAKSYLLTADKEGIDDPPSALLCISRAEKILDDLSEEGEHGGGSLRERVGLVRTEAVSALPGWLFKAKLGRLKFAVRELLEQWNRQDEPRGVAEFLRDPAPRELVDELSFHSDMLKDLEFSDEDRKTLRRLMHSRRAGVQRALDLMAAIRVLEKGDSTILQRWHLAREVKRLDPDLPEVDSLTAEIRAEYEAFTDQFRKLRNKIGEDLINTKIEGTQGAGEALREALVSLGKLKEMLGDGGEYANDLKEGVDTWGRILEKAGSVLQMLEQVVTRRMRRNIALRMLWQSDGTFGALLDEAEQLFKAAESEEKAKSYIKTILQLTKPEKDDKPSYAYRYESLICEGATATHGGMSPTPAKKIASAWYKGKSERVQLHAEIARYEQGDPRQALLGKLDRMCSRYKRNFVLTVVAVIALGLVGFGFVGFQRISYGRVIAGIAQEELVRAREMKKRLAATDSDRAATGTGNSTAVAGNNSAASPVPSPEPDSASPPPAQDQNK